MFVCWRCLVTWATWSAEKASREQKLHTFRTRRVKLLVSPSRGVITGIWHFLSLTGLILRGHLSPTSIYLPFWAGSCPVYSLWTLQWKIPSDGYCQGIIGLVSCGWCFFVYPPGPWEFCATFFCCLAKGKEHPWFDSPFFVLRHWLAFTPGSDWVDIKKQFVVVKSDLILLAKSSMTMILFAFFVIFLFVPFLTSTGLAALALTADQTPRGARFPPAGRGLPCPGHHGQVERVRVNQATARGVGSETAAGAGREIGARYVGSMEETDTNLIADAADIYQQLGDQVSKGGLEGADRGWLERRGREASLGYLCLPASASVSYQHIFTSVQQGRIMECHGRAV